MRRELSTLDSEHGGPEHAYARIVQALMLRMLPGVCGRVARHLHALPGEAARQILDDLIATSPYREPRMRRFADRLRAHLGGYADSLSRWDGWEPVDLSDSGIGEDPDAESDASLAAWRRPSDGVVAGDFVGFVYDPRDLMRPTRRYALFAQDAGAAHGRLGEEFGSDFRGLRLWILGADHRPVVRWLTAECD